MGNFNKRQADVIELLSDTALKFLVGMAALVVFMVGFFKILNYMLRGECEDFSVAILTFFEGVLIYSFYKIISYYFTRKPKK